MRGVSKALLRLDHQQTANSIIIGVSDDHPPAATATATDKHHPNRTLIPQPRPQPTCHVCRGSRLRRERPRLGQLAPQGRRVPRPPVVAHQVVRHGRLVLRPDSSHRTGAQM
jgi:hypothetical protein